MLARSVLWYVTFAGFAINYMHRIHINIILVGMVKQKVRGSVGSANNSLPVSECISNYPILENNNQSISDSSIAKIIHEDGFDWDERQQNYILGSFYWLHWLTQIPGGVLARRFGTKKIFGLSNFISCVLTLILPTVAKFDFRLLVFVRILQGFITGVAWPSMHHLTAHWIPPNERSKFVSSYLGSSVGVAVTYAVCGFIMDSYGWEAAFYATGFFGVAWYICWLCLVFNTPADHPRISAKEKQYIEKSLEQAITTRKMSVPWRHVLLSGPIWMVALAQWGGIWGFYTLTTQAPTYFKNILGWNIRMTGIFSAIPHLTRWLFSFISAIAADYLLKSKLLSRTNVRKLATSTCTLVQGIMVLGLAMSGCNSTAAIAFVIAATGVSGAVSSGPLACVVDISPNFASVLLGLVGLIGNLPGFMSPLVVGYLTYQQQTAEQWQKVFLISTVILVVSGILYIMYGEAEVQSWNNGSERLKDVENKDEKETEKDKEMKVMPLLIEQQNTTNGFTIGGDDIDEKRSL